MRETFFSLPSRILSAVVILKNDGRVVIYEESTVGIYAMRIVGADSSAALADTAPDAGPDSGPDGGKNPGAGEHSGVDVDTD